MGKNNQVCPVERAGFLDSKVRRFFHNPRKILAPYIRQGMTVLDLGCGPGLFSLEIGKMVGESGKVIAADLQEGMLQIVLKKIQQTELEKRIELHQCQEDKIGFQGKVDFVLAFYMLHEVPNQEKVLREIRSILNPGGKLFIVEPKFHVSQQAFQDTLDIARKVGLKIAQQTKNFLSLEAVLARD